MDNFVTKVICSSCGKPLMAKMDFTFGVLTIETEICDPCRKAEEERVLIAHENEAVDELAALKVTMKTRDDRIKELEDKEQDEFHEKNTRYKKYRIDDRGKLKSHPKGEVTLEIRYVVSGEKCIAPERVIFDRVAQDLITAGMISGSCQVFVESVKIK